MLSNILLWAALPLSYLAAANTIQNAAVEDAGAALKPRQYAGIVFYYESDCESYYSTTCYTCVYSTDWCPSGMCLADGSCGSTSFTTSSDSSTSDYTGGTDYGSTTDTSDSSTDDYVYDDTASDSSTEDTTTTSDETTTQSTPSRGRGKLSPAAMKGIIAGVVVVVAIVIAIFSWLFVRRRNMKKRQRSAI